MAGTDPLASHVSHAEAPSRPQRILLKSTSSPYSGNGESDLQTARSDTGTICGVEQSINTTKPGAYWRPAKRRPGRCLRKATLSPFFSLSAWAHWLLVIISLILLTLTVRTRSGNDRSEFDRDRQSTSLGILRPSLPEQSSYRQRSDPANWLKEHTLMTDSQKNDQKHRLKRTKAAVISLVRNTELEGILQSMRQLEHHWNKRYRYPWIFFSEEHFSDEFKAATSNATLASTSYEMIPESHWSTPDWIDRNLYMDSLEYLSQISVGKGHMLSYRNMCRWNSGFFYKHPALQPFDYYWRVEPDVHFFCDIPYDPFEFMDQNDLIYGFNMNILDDARSFASLWKKTIDFVNMNPHLVHEDADLTWVINPDVANDYNNCQFFSNFEIGSLHFFRGKANEAYFDYLDRSGGFYYERYGDAPVHTLSVALFAPKDKVWFFRDIGYQHDIARHCPLEGVRDGRCACEPTGLDENFYKLVPMESPQVKPEDTCIRQWLGGAWLEKKDGWSRKAEEEFGGDGYNGYIKHTDK